MKNAQNAGAVAVVIVDNVTSGHPPTVGGTDPTVVIPSLGITQSDGATLRAALRHRSRTRSGVLASLRLDPTRPLGTNELGFVQMFAPNPFISGSSVAHWEIRLFPDQSLEAGNPPTATHSVMPPNDLALPALRDLGW